MLIRKNAFISSMVFLFAAPLTAHAQSPAVSLGSLEVETNDEWGRNIYQLDPESSSVVAGCSGDGLVQISSALLKFYGEKSKPNGGKVVYDWTMNLSASGSALNGTLELVRSDCGPLGRCAVEDTGRVQTSGNLYGPTVLNSNGTQTSFSLFDHPRTDHTWVAFLTPCETPTSTEDPEAEPEPSQLKVR